MINKVYNPNYSRLKSTESSKNRLGDYLTLSHHKKTLKKKTKFHNFSRLSRSEEKLETLYDDHCPLQKSAKKPQKAAIEIEGLDQEKSNFSFKNNSKHEIKSTSIDSRNKSVNYSIRKGLQRGEQKK